MPTGLEIRAQIDSENVQGLLLINGGAAVALLTFFPVVLGKPGLEPLARSVITAIFIFLVGLIAAVAHNRHRRLCSLHYEKYNFDPPVCRYIPAWLKRREPCICAVSTIFMWLSLAAFFTGGVIVTCGGFQVLGYKAESESIPCWELQQLNDQILRVNRCTGSWETVTLPATSRNKPLQPSVPKNGTPTDR